MAARTLSGNKPVAWYHVRLGEMGGKTVWQTEKGAQKEGGGRPSRSQIAGDCDAEKIPRKLRSRRSSLHELLLGKDDSHASTSNSGSLDRAEVGWGGLGGYALSYPACLGIVCCRQAAQPSGPHDGRRALGGF